MTPTVTTPPTTDPIPLPTPAVPDLLAEPTWEEIIVEGNHYSDDLKAGRLDFTGIPEGHYFAYYGGRVRGHDADGWALQHRAAAELGVHWARVIIDYYGEW